MFTTVKNKLRTHAITIHTQDHTILKREVKTDVEKESTQVLCVSILLNILLPREFIRELAEGRKNGRGCVKDWASLDTAGTSLLVFFAQVTADRSGRTSFRSVHKYLICSGRSRCLQTRYEILLRK